MDTFSRKREHTFLRLAFSPSHISFSECCSRLIRLCGAHCDLDLDGGVCEHDKQLLQHLLLLPGFIHGVAVRELSWHLPYVPPLRKHENGNTRYSRTYCICICMLCLFFFVLSSSAFSRFLSFFFSPLLLQVAGPMPPPTPTCAAPTSQCSTCSSPSKSWDSYSWCVLAFLFDRVKVLATRALLFLLSSLI